MMHQSVAGSCASLSVARSRDKFPSSKSEAKATAWLLNFIEGLPSFEMQEEISYLLIHHFEHMHTQTQVKCAENIEKILEKIPGISSHDSSSLTHCLDVIMRHRDPVSRLFHKVSGSFTTTVRRFSITEDLCYFIETVRLNQKLLRTPQHRRVGITHVVPMPRRLCLELRRITPSSSADDELLVARAAPSSRCVTSTAAQAEFDFELPAGLRDSCVYFVGGAFNELTAFKDFYFRDIRDLLKSKGVPARYKGYSSRKSIIHNVRSLSEDVRRYYKETGKKVVVAGHSKGGGESLATVLFDSGLIADGIVDKVILLAPAIGGSELAEELCGSVFAPILQSLLGSGLRSITPAVANVIFKYAFASFEHDNRLESQRNAVSDRVFYVRFATQEPLSLDLRFMRFLCDSRIFDRNPNDALLLDTAQILQGFGRDVGLFDADHNQFIISTPAFASKTTPQERQKFMLKIFQTVYSPEVEEATTPLLSKGVAPEHCEIKCGLKLPDFEHPKLFKNGLTDAAASRLKLTGLFAALSLTSMAVCVAAPFFDLPMLTSAVRSFALSSRLSSFGTLGIATAGAVIACGFIFVSFVSMIATLLFAQREAKSIKKRE